MLHTRLIIPPVNTVVTVAEIRAHASGTPSQFDPLIEAFIPAATEQAQEDTWRQFLFATYEMKLPSFCDVIYFPHPPLSGVNSIEYIDNNGTTQTLATSAYQVDTHGEPGSVRPAINTTWPSTQSGAVNAVTIRYTAGYAMDSGDPLFPAMAKMMVKFLTTQFLQRRAPTSFLQGIVLAPIPYTYDDMLHKLRFRDERILPFR